MPSPLHGPLTMTQTNISKVSTRDYFISLPQKVGPVSERVARKWPLTRFNWVATVPVSSYVRTRRYYHPYYYCRRSQATLVTDGVKVKFIVKSSADEASNGPRGHGFDSRAP